MKSEIAMHKGNHAYAWARGTRVEVLLRPDDIVPDPASLLQAQVVQKAIRGAEILYTLRLRSVGRVLSQLPSHADHALGERVGIRVQADHLAAFPLSENHSPKTTPAAFI